MSKYRKIGFYDPKNTSIILKFLFILTVTFVVIAVEPESPDLLKESIADDHFNVTLIPGAYDDEIKRPVGNDFYIRYREAGDDKWNEQHPEPDQLTTSVGGLQPGTRYEVQVVSVQTDEDGKVHETTSRTHHITTTGTAPMKGYLWAFILLALILLLLICICIICFCTRKRGQKYLVAEKERQQGREPILPRDRAFEDYAKRLVISPFFTVQRKLLFQ